MPALSWLTVTISHDVMCSVIANTNNTVACVRNSKFYRQQCK